MHLAARGAAVVVNDVGASAHDVVAEIVGAGGTALACEASVATGDGAASIVEAALATFGRLDIVINNAAILQSADMADMTEALWDSIVGVNLRGSFLVTQAAWAHLAQQGYGRVVFTTSNSGLLGNAGSTAYSASKAALWGLTRTLALEGKPLGIGVNCIAPIAFTAMSRASRTAPPVWKSGEGDAWSARLRPSLVSPAMAWLAHEDCELTGEVLSVAAGRVARFFLGLTPGFVDDDLTAESLRDHLDDVRSETGYEVLPSALDEGRRLHRRLFPR
ncbi:MAG: putative short-chain dehydrogenase [Acidimicrobiia bacterium]|nr:putative short-chain dehydrogenase [Acidimicrobiia bacterium]